MNKILQTTLCGLTAASLALVPLNTYAMSQDETVYVKLQPNGTQSYTSVTKHLLNNSKSATLQDKTTLTNIENINGFESFDFTKNLLTWNANGADIYYTGETTQKLPITVDVTYKLNGTEKPIEEILGKAGNVEITFRYHNSAKVGNLYTPFVVMLATTLPESSIHNVSVTNGKVISNGRNLAVTAIAAPGLYESLQLDEIKNMDKIVLTFETDQFELKDIYNIVTPKILDESDLKVFDQVDKLASDAKKLSDGSKELVKGTQELQSGVQELYRGIKQAQAQFNNAGKLLDENTLEEIAHTAARTASRKIATMQSTINQQVSSQMDALMSKIDISFSPAEQQALAQNVITQTCTQATPAPNPSADDTESVPTAAAGLDPLCVKYVQDALGKTMQVLPGVIENKISALVPTIRSTVANSLYQQIEQVATETASTTASNVASQVADSIQVELKEKLNAVMSKILTNMQKLLDGAGKLNTGMEKFDADGIQNLNKVVNNKLKTTSTKAQQLIKLADQYNNFSGIADDASGTTKFIMMIDGRKK